MDAFVIGLVVASAILHVAWNVRLKTAGDPLVTATIGLAAGAVVVVPLGFVVWLAEGGPPIPPEVVALGLVSSVFETAYFVLLAEAYRRGDLSVVYPIARGTAPLLLVVVGIVVLGERLGTAGWIGVGALLAGFLALQRPWLALRAAATRSGSDRAIPFALATGLAIAGYTSIDRLATRLIHPIPYASIIWLCATLLLVAWVVLVRRGPPWPEPPVVREASVGGVLMLGAYVLILFALSVAPLTAVAPLRESATVGAAAWGVMRLGEAVTRGEATRRIVASIAIVGGAILLAIDS